MKRMFHTDIMIKSIFFSFLCAIYYSIPNEKSSILQWISLKRDSDNRDFRLIGIFPMKPIFYVVKPSG